MVDIDILGAHSKLQRSVLVRMEGGRDMEGGRLSVHTSILKYMNNFHTFSRFLIATDKVDLDIKACWYA